MSGQNTTVTGSILHTLCELNYWAKIRGKSTKEISNGDGIAISWGALTTCHPGIIGETHPHLPITLQTPTKMPRAHLNGWGGPAISNGTDTGAHHPRTGTQLDPTWLV